VTYLWDTCVLSDLGKANRDPHVMEYLDSIPIEKTYISVVTIGEIEFGFALLPVGRRRRELEATMRAIITELSSQVLPITAEIATLWGELSADVHKRGRDLPAGDGLIAATALHHGLTVVTRNVSDFEPTGVSLVNPWA
jgi:predicted nucleic acid-binding protein